MGKKCAFVNTSKCIGCGACSSVCPVGALSFKNGVMTVDKAKCIGCGACGSACPVEAIEVK